MINEHLEKVQLDGLVVLQIIQHCRASYPIHVTGQLLGREDKGVLQITHAFPIPLDIYEVGKEQYQLDMMRCLRAANMDSNTVGWYRSAQFGDYIDLDFIETQYNHQSSLAGQSVVLIYDVSKSNSQGNLSLKAFRLTDKFMDAYKNDKFTTESLAQANLSSSDIFQELPTEIHNSHLATLMLHNMEISNVNNGQLPVSHVCGSTTSQFDSDTTMVPRLLSPNYDTLNLELNSFMHHNVECLIDCADVQQQEQHWQRSFRYKQDKMQAWLAQRQEKGLPEEEEERRQTLPSMVLNAQMNNFTRQMNQFSGPSLVKLYTIQGLNNTSGLT